MTRSVERVSPPIYRIWPGIDPTNDWRAPFVYWDKNALSAAAHDWVGLKDIFYALASEDITGEEASEALCLHRMTRLEFPK